MSIRNISIDLDEAVFANAEEILSEIGLDIPTYIRMALIKLKREKRIPFDLTSSQSLTESQSRLPISSPIINPMGPGSRETEFLRRVPRQTNKITYEMCLTLWNEFKQDYSSGNRNLQEIAQIINARTGMNRGSAFIYLTILNNLVNGVHNTRTLKYEDLEYFVDKIKTEFPETVLKATISSLELSVPYWEEKVTGSFADKVRRLVAKHKNLF